MTRLVRRYRRQCSVALAALLLMLASSALAAQAVGAQCSSPNEDGAREIERGWSALRASKIDEADARFHSALTRCPDYPPALVGVAYVAMRHGDDGRAAGVFSRVVAAQPANYDALVGLGILGYRHGDLSASWRRFAAALAVVPGDSVSLWYLDRIPGARDSLTLRPPPRPPRTVVAARTGVRIFQVPNDSGGWKPLWIKAVNLGAALPGKHASEFPPDDGTYEHWIELAARMNANAIRVYTIHPPHFYRALARWNASHTDRPLWLIQGVWTELPPGHPERSGHAAGAGYSRTRPLIATV